MSSTTTTTTSSPPEVTTTTTPSSTSLPWSTCFRPGLFRDRVALVTGGGTGIGRAVAWELATLGATVVIASRDARMCELAAGEMNQQLQQLQSTYHSGSAVGKVVAGPATSIRNEEQVKQLVAHIVATYRAIHLVVNNAGGQFVTPSEALSKNGFAAVVDTNLLGTFLVCREVYNQYLIDHPEVHGSMVNITIGLRNGMPYMMHSAAARAGVENMTISLAQEWIEQNVRLNCVRPGIIWTDSGFANYGEAGEELSARILPTLPARRYGTAEEVSSAVVWLLSPGAQYVTGQVIPVCGGSSFTALPLHEIPNQGHLLPAYGNLPSRAKL